MRFEEIANLAIDVAIDGLAVTLFVSSVLSLASFAEDNGISKLLIYVAAVAVSGVAARVIVYGTGAVKYIIYEKFFSPLRYFGKYDQIYAVLYRLGDLVTDEERFADYCKKHSIESNEQFLIKNCLKDIILTEDVIKVATDFVGSSDISATYFVLCEIYDKVVSQNDRLSMLIKNTADGSIPAIDWEPKDIFEFHKITRKIVKDRNIINAGKVTLEMKEVNFWYELYATDFITTDCGNIYDEADVDFSNVQSVRKYICPIREYLNIEYEYYLNIEYEYYINGEFDARVKEMEAKCIELGIKLKDDALVGKPTISSQQQGCFSDKDMEIAIRRLRKNFCNERIEDVKTISKNLYQMRIEVFASS